MSSNNRVRNIAPITPRSSIAFAPETYWLRVMMDELSGTNIVSQGVDSLGAFSDTEAVVGTTTGIWHTSGNFDINGDNAMETTHDMGDICRTDTLNGTIMVFFRYGGNGSGTTGTDYIAQYRTPFGAFGWGIRVLNNRRIQFAFTDSGGSDTQSALSGSELTDVAGETQGVVGLIHRAGSGDTTYNCYSGGATVTSGTTAKTVDVADGPNDGAFGLFGRITDTGGVASQTPAGILCSDVLVIRTPVDLRANAQRIADEYNSSKWEMLNTLKQLGV